MWMLRGKEAWFAIGIGSKIEDYLRYLDEVEINLRSMKSSIVTEADKYPAEAQDDYWDHYIDEYHNYNVIFPTFLKNSVFISLYSFFEYELLNMCDKEMLKEFRRDNGIFKARKCLNRLYDSPDILNNETWIYIQACNQIRNCIVHNGGNVTYYFDDSKETALRQAVAKLPNVTINDDVIVITEEFCNDFGEAISVVLKTIFLLRGMEV